MRCRPEAEETIALSSPMLSLSTASSNSGCMHLGVIGRGGSEYVDWPGGGKWVVNLCWVN